MVQVITGDSQEEVMIFCYRQTHRHFIIIYISSPLSSWSRSGLVPHMAVSLPLAPLPSPTPGESPAGSPATLSFPVLCGEAYILHMRHISHIYACFQVQTHCPFNIIEDEPSMASGDPTFLCRGPSSTFCSFIKRFFCKIHFLFILF